MSHLSQISALVHGTLLAAVALILFSFWGRQEGRVAKKPKAAKPPKSTKLPRQLPEDPIARGGVIMREARATKRRQILHLMVKGNGINAISRLTGAFKNTVLRHLGLAGQACMMRHDAIVRGVKAQRVERDEFWSFNYCKKANLPEAKAAPEGADHVWTWTAIGADSKLIVSYVIGGRDADAAQDFMHDVAHRLANRVQLTTDGHGAYLSAVMGGLRH